MGSELTVEQRQETGSLRMERMRQGGKVPAVLYGGEEGNMLLSLCQIELGKAINSAINSGSRDVQLAGATACRATIKAIQWDTFGTEVVHVDFVRA